MAAIGFAHGTKYATRSTVEVMGRLSNVLDT